MPEKVCKMCNKPLDSESEWGLCYSCAMKTTEYEHDVEERAIRRRHSLYDREII